VTRNTPPHSEHFLAIYSLTQEELNWITLCTCIAPFALFPDSSTEAGMGYCYEQIAPIYSPSCERKKEEVQKNYHRSRFLSFLPLSKRKSNTIQGGTIPLRQILSLFLVVAAVIMGISAADTAKEFLAWILPLLISWAQMPDISALINKVMVKGNGLI